LLMEITMQSYLVAIRLPKTVCRRLTTLCFGIPEASWETEENFVISLYPLGKIDDTLLDEVKEMLKGISGTSPLSTVLAGAQCTPVGRSQVRLWRFCKRFCVNSLEGISSLQGKI
jgi:2'-5' RNA ligase